MEAEVDIFLPFWWKLKHTPQGVWETSEIQFNRTLCLESPTRYEQAEFSMTWDEAVSRDPEARVIGYVAAIQDTRANQVLDELRPYLDVLGNDLVEALPKHSTYDCKIELKEGATAPWGPIYPLSETELQTLREWQKEMEKSGKIRPSTSPAGSPILLVPKPNGKGLRLCVDY